MPKLEVVNANNVIEFNPQKANFKLKNTGGPKGEPGAQGPQGPKGDTGAQGPAGASASVTVGSTTTLSPGATATVTNSGDTRNAILNFGIPTGARGPKGDTGSKGDTGLMGPKGAKGDTGAAATVQVGNTNTGAPGTNAQVTNAGNEHFAVFDFTIPRGDKGEKGATGAQGAKGDKGDRGDAGTAATITVGSTTTTNPGTNATVTNSGTTSAAVLNFGIPRGATGSVKSDVVAELPETGEEDTFYLVNREATEQTATGKAINFTNSDNSGDITDFKLDGETSQNGTPTPDAPVAVNTTTGENVVKITGKNLCDGVNQNYWLNAGAYSAGQTTGNSGVGISVSANTDYTISTKVSQARYRAAFTDSLPTSNAGIGAYNGQAKDGTSDSITINSGSHGYLIVNATSLSDIQIEKSSSASDFEPYQGHSYEVNLGKNLFDVANAQMTVARLNSQGAVTTGITNRLCTLGYIEVKPNTAYTLSATPEISGKTLQAYIVGYSESGSSTSIANYPSNAWYGFPITFTTGSNCRYIRVSYRYSDDSDMAATSATNQQLELGSQPTSYAAYFEPIELCKIGDYQDHIYKSGDKWYVRKEVGKANLATDRTSLGKISAGGGFRGFTVSVNTGASARTGDASVVIPLFCNMLACTNRSNTYELGSQNSISAGTTNEYYKDFFFDPAPINDYSVADAATWLNNNPIIVYYPLATPTDTEITNEALVEQLDNVASAPLYTGVNNITTITPNEQGTLEIKYVTYDQYNQNKVYIWNDTLQQWQIIVP